LTSLIRHRAKGMITPPRHRGGLNRNAAGHRNVAQIPSEYLAGRRNFARIPSEYRASHCNVARSRANIWQAIATLRWPQLK
ncbi:MAG: hypothetical protein LBF91_10510, partial [Azoarcus sp.]|nr:hypothetical protein [Azoarcus sp.]